LIENDPTNVSAILNRSLISTKYIGTFSFIASYIFTFHRLLPVIYSHSLFSLSPSPKIKKKQIKTSSFFFPITDKQNQALEDAQTAISLTNIHSSPLQFIKAHHRAAEALLAMNRTIPAIKMYKSCLNSYHHHNSSSTNPSTDILPPTLNNNNDDHMQPIAAALRLACNRLPPSWLAKYWSTLIFQAEAPHPLSSRDGRLLKPVPIEHRLTTVASKKEEGEEEGGGGEFVYTLGRVLAETPPLLEAARDAMCEAWTAGLKKPGRAGLALLRGAVYLSVGNGQQAIKDAKVALVYGPQESNPYHHQKKNDNETNNGENVAPPTRPAWAPALGLLSGGREMLGDNISAILAAARAVEVDGYELQFKEAGGSKHESEEKGGNDDKQSIPKTENNKENVSYYQAAVDRLINRIPEPAANALRQGEGSSGLEDFLFSQQEAARPEFLKNRPKYYYYYEWMRKRIEGMLPGLPDPVMDKLLTMDANELDLILQYPGAVKQTAGVLMKALRENGEEELGTMAVPLLSWEEMEGHKANINDDIALGAIMNGEDGERKKERLITEREEEEEEGDEWVGDEDHESVVSILEEYDDNDEEAALFGLD